MCSKLPESLFDALCEGGKCIQWICDSCQNREGMKRDERDSKLDHLIRKIESMDEKINKLEQGYTGVSLDEKIEKAVERKLAEALDERGEIEKRKLNLIVVGVHESEEVRQVDRDREDTARLREMLKNVDPVLADETIEEPTRLGRKTNKPRLLRFKVKNEVVKENILKNYFKLNSSKTRPDERIYFNHDLTPSQRDTQ